MKEITKIGITHTIKHIFVDERKKLLLECYKFDCRSCGNTNLKRVVSLRCQPLANNLINKKDEKCDLYPLEVNCVIDVIIVNFLWQLTQKKCFQIIYIHLQLQSFRNHFRKQQKNIQKKLNKKSIYYWCWEQWWVALKPFLDLGFKKVLGVEPTKILQNLRKKKIKTFNSFLDKKNIKKIKGNADLILASNVFAHSDRLKKWPNACYIC